MKSNNFYLGISKAQIASCKVDSDCDKICGRGKGYCEGGMCECPRVKFAEQKLCPDHHSKK